MISSFNLPHPAVDTRNMLSGLLGFPEDCLSAIESRIPSIDDQTQGIVIVGMGGSGIVGDYIKAASKRTMKIPILSFKGGPLPRFINRNWTAFVVSYSGNTEETLEVMDEVLEREIPVFAVTSGGAMGEKAKRNKVPVIQIKPGILAPRMGLAQMFISIYKTLSQSSFLPPMEEILKEVKELLGNIRSEFVNSFRQNQAYLDLPKDIIKGSIAIYAETDLLAVAYRLKCQLNENVKTKAWIGEFPEVCHNEVEAWNASTPRDPKSSVVHIQNSCNPKTMSSYKQTFRKLLEKQKIPQYCIEAKGTHPICHLLTATYQVDLLSYYLAVRNGVDPTPIPGIRWIKDRKTNL